ncbi:hypothetical protein QD336_00515 [Rhizobium sp. BR 250]
MTETTISVRPIVVMSQTFTDGVEMFETASQHRGWGIFIIGPDMNIAGTAPNRQAAIDAATELAMQQGWKVIHTAPEAEETPKGKTLQ